MVMAHWYSPTAETTEKGTRQLRAATVRTANGERRRTDEASDAPRRALGLVHRNQARHETDSKSGDHPSGDERAPVGVELDADLQDRASDVKPRERVRSELNPETAAGATTHSETEDETSGHDSVLPAEEV